MLAHSRCSVSRARSLLLLLLVCAVCSSRSTACSIGRVCVLLRSLSRSVAATRACASDVSRSIACLTCVALPALLASRCFSRAREDSNLGLERSQLSSKSRYAALEPSATTHARISMQMWAIVLHAFGFSRGNCRNVLTDWRIFFAKRSLERALARIFRIVSRHVHAH